jgi:ABC-2 type transport system ATP-binding protein
LKHVVTTTHLTKKFGRITAVNDLNLRIPEWSVFGLLGPNGSGKTTTLGMLLDVVNPSSGTYSWFNNFSEKENRQKIGSILETPAFYPYLSALDNLKIIAEIKAIGYDNMADVLKLTGLFDRRHSAYRTYSLGMKQRLALASALLCDPEVMILDEPTNGLDPAGIAEIRELIKTISLQGKTIILASHLLDEVQKVCSHFAVLKQGYLLYSGLVNEVGRDEIQLEIAAPDLNLLRIMLENYPEIRNMSTEREFLRLTLPGHSSVEALSRFVFEKGQYITHLVTRKRSLESQFLDILKEKS